MENRRQHNPNSTDKPFNRNKFQQRPNERYSNDRPSQSREGGFPKKEGSFQPRGGDKFQPREGGYPKREGGFQSREGGYQKREGGFQKREGGYQGRDNRFQNRPPNRFDPKKRFDPKAKPNPVNLSKVYSEMQVTDGKHRGKFFQSTTSPKVRPTTRRIRETLFKIISRRVRGRRFLDLCAGSGAVGLEAVSRGSLLSNFC